MKKSLLLIVLTPAIIFIISRWNSLSFFSTEHIYGLYDSSLSCEYATSINTALVDLVRSKNSARSIIAQLQEQFSFLQKITVAYQPLAVRVMISAHKPLCLVNNEWVFTQRAKMIPQHIFSERTLAAIPRITIVDENIYTMQQMVDQLLQRLPDEMYDTYAVELLNEHCVRLIDKKQTKFTIVSALVQPQLAATLIHCNAVKQALDARGEFNKETKWIADTRFAHYIVAYRA
jgi:hypothetical protein